MVLNGDRYRGETRGSMIIAIGKGRVHLQRPKRFGASRHGTNLDLMEDLSEVRSVVFVDLRRFPEVALIDVPAQLLIDAVANGELTVSGWSGGAFDQWLLKTFRLDHGEVRADALAGRAQTDGVIEINSSSAETPLDDSSKDNRKPDGKPT